MSRPPPLFVKLLHLLATLRPKISLLFGSQFLLVVQDQHALQSNDVPTVPGVPSVHIHYNKQSTHPDWADPGGLPETNRNRTALAS